MDSKVREIFVESCMEQLAHIEESILDLEHVSGEELQERLKRVFRAAHSIKGDAGSMGLEAVSGYAHAIENILHLLQQGELSVVRLLISELLFAFDRLKGLIRETDLANQPDLSDEKSRLQALLSLAAPEPVPARNPAPQPSSDPKEAAPPESDAMDSPSGPDKSGKADRPLADFSTESKITRVNIPAEQLDILVDRVGELAIVQTRLSRMASVARDKTFLPVAEEIESLCSLLRDQVLSLRMLPLGVSYPKYRRLVRDLCGELGKEVQFDMQGRNTELDKKLIEELNTPLIHLLRNAVDHGIEPPSMREYLGKPPKGSITIKAAQSGGEVLLEVADDGRGIDSEKLYRTALDSGMIETGRELALEEKLDLIFLPGLSTAKQVGEISGRGVGMDAVKASIIALRGKIEVSSAPDKGTRFSIQLPVSMAIIDCLRVEVAGDDYFMHLDYVEECVELNLTPEQRNTGVRGARLARGAPAPHRPTGIFPDPGPTPQDHAYRGGAYQSGAFRRDD